MKNHSNIVQSNQIMSVFMDIYLKSVHFTVQCIPISCSLAYLSIAHSLHQPRFCCPNYSCQLFQACILYSRNRLKCFHEALLCLRANAGNIQQCRRKTCLAAFVAVMCDPKLLGVCLKLNYL